MIHDLADHHWPDARIRIRQACALPELRDGTRIIHTERSRTHGNELLATIAGNIAAKGDAVVGGPEFHARAIARENVVGGSREHHLVTAGTYSERDGRFIAVRKMRFVDN